MKSYKNALRAALALLATSGFLALSGCGESTNIAAEGGGTASACSNLLNANCVTGRFIDDAAVNVDYECTLTGVGTVRSVTEIDGSFSCPNGSTATFSLTNPDNPEYKLVLGTVIVSRPAKVYGDDAELPVYFYVTPLDLTEEDEDSATLSNPALNITRLLQAMSTDDVDPTHTKPYLPTRRVVIATEDKRKITPENINLELDFSLPPADDPLTPTAGSFDEAVADFLVALSRPPLIEKSKAITILQKGVHSTVAGIYQVPGGAILSSGGLSPTDLEYQADLGAMTGSDGTNSFVGAFWELVDRRGRMIGSGVYSYGKPVNPPWTIWSDPEPMELTTTGPELTHASGVSLWPNDGDLTGMRLALLGSHAGKSANITQGEMRRAAIAGSPTVYLNLFEETASSDALGRWSLVEGATDHITGGAYTLVRSTAVATWMNPARWGALDFPLPIRVSLYNFDYGNATCADGSSGQYGCKIADIRMVILEDGNIISDFSQRCGVGIDLDTLRYDSGTGPQEIPLGVVSNILDTLNDQNGSPMVAMTLLAMLPDDARLVPTAPEYAEYLPYIQFGSNLGGNSLLRTDGVADAFKMYGTCATQPSGLCNNPGGFAPGTASWLNFYTFMRYQEASAANAASADTLIKNYGGRMESALLDKNDAAVCLR